MPSTRRENYGKGHRYYLDDLRAIGVTTALGEGFPKPALINWAGNTTAGYAVDHWAELADMEVSARLDLLRRCRYLERDEAAKRGTEVHTLALALAAGQEVSVPDELVGHVDSYMRFAEEWESLERLAEVVVINRRFRYMGTLDLVTNLADARTWLLDIKTTRSGVYSENALQLAAY